MDKANKKERGGSFLFLRAGAGLWAGQREGAGHNSGVGRKVTVYLYTGMVSQYTHTHTHNLFEKKTKKTKKRQLD